MNRPRFIFSARQRNVVGGERGYSKESHHNFTHSNDGRRSDENKAKTNLTPITYSSLSTFYLGHVEGGREGGREGGKRLREKWGRGGGYLVLSMVNINCIYFLGNTKERRRSYG